MLSIILLLLIIFLSWKAAPREREEDVHVHGAGQVGLLAALALFGVDYFTSYFYATGEMMSALHPYGLQQYAYIPVVIIGLANLVFGGLYMYALGIFRNGGGSYTASMRYLLPTVSLIVAVTLEQDYILTIVVSALSGGDQLLSILNAYGAAWYWHFAIGAFLASITWFLTIRGRGESARVVFTLLGVFVGLTLTMALGLITASARGVPPYPPEEVQEATSIGEALLHLLTASMKGMVALTGLEAMSDGIQFVIDEDAAIVKWGKRKLPQLKRLWEFYSGKVGIGRFVQTSFLFYGGLTTAFLSAFAIRFNVFDGTAGRTLVGNLAYIGFTQLFGNDILFWTYQILAVMLLAAASLTAFQDLQATGWRDVAMGEIPEYVVYRDPRGTFTRSVNIAFIIAILIMFLVRGRTTVAVPFYGIGVFVPITMMALAIRQHIRKHLTGRARRWGMVGATVAAAWGTLVFVGQVVGKWHEGGWIALISFTVLALMAHLVLLSPIGYRQPEQIHRIVRQKARVQGTMANIVEWQALRMQGYRYTLLVAIARFFEMLGIRRPVRYEPPPPAGTYEEAVAEHVPEAPSFLEQYLQPRPQPHIGGAPMVTAPPRLGPDGKPMESFVPEPPVAGSAQVQRQESEAPSVDGAAQLPQQEESKAKARRQKRSGKANTPPSV